MKKLFAGTAFIFALITIISADAQTTQYTWGDKSYIMLERLEIKAQTEQRFNTNLVRQFERKKNTEAADSIWQLVQNRRLGFELTEVDQYYLERLIASSAEYSKLVDGPASLKSSKPVARHFWPTPGNFIEVNTEDFYLSINPALSQQQSLENDFDSRVYVNSKGMNARGLIANKIGFKMFVTDNQEQGPSQFREFVQQHRAVPGAGFWKTFKNNKGVDYIDARGSVDFNITPFINTSFGFDQHFIGDGYRSMFRSDFSPAALYLSLHTRIGKLDYYNLFNELVSFPVNRGDVLFNKKYMATHHLSYMVKPWLRIGIFESMVFAKPNKFDITYLNPIILANTAFRRKGGENNASLGMDFKANFPYNFQVYGQYLLDNLDGNSAGKNGWNNNNSWQLGGKVIDLFTIEDLDAQVEVNQVRPFTYARPDSVSQFTSYLQPLAHPLGANFKEYIGILRYRPFPKWLAQAKLIWWKQGVDSEDRVVGSNPNKLTVERNGDTGFELYTGEPLKVLNASGLISYEIRENLFLEGMGMLRLQKKGNPEVKKNTIMATAGIRWNMFRRSYEY